MHSYKEPQKDIETKFGREIRPEEKKSKKKENKKKKRYKIYKWKQNHLWTQGN